MTTPLPPPGTLVGVIESRLNERLAPTFLQVDDDSAQHAGHAGATAGGHYSVTIVAAAFAGKSRVARHRLVYDALTELMRNGIHALAVSAYTSEEFNLSNR